MDVLSATKTNLCKSLGFMLIVLCSDAILTSQHLNGAVLPLDLSATLTRETKYVTEGRNNLPQGGIDSIELGAGFKGLGLGLWYAKANKDPFRELDLSLSYEKTWMGMEFGVGATILEFLEAKEMDREFSLSWGCTVFEWLSPSLEAVHSMDADGVFLEAGLSMERSFFDDRLAVEPYLAQGFDFGYASTAYDGPNHTQAGVTASWAFSEVWSLSATISRSWASEDVKRDGLGHLTWQSFSLAASF